MRVIAKLGREDIATVYIADFGEGRLVEFVESVEPSIPREKKWVSIISTLYGCPVSCRICDAGRDYSGALSFDEMMSQIDYLVELRFPGGVIPVEKWKIQFARMGEPSFNLNVLDVLEALPEKYRAPGLMPSISTIAPHGTDRFFTELLELKKRLYPTRFQFQFSIHSTDPATRRRLMPLKTWDFEQMAEYGRDFFDFGGRKIGLNFALMQDVPIDPSVIQRYFDAETFLIKLTPLNPTQNAVESGCLPLDVDSPEAVELVDTIKSLGYRVIVSVGELEENAIGSNCGQYVSKLKEEAHTPVDAYFYPVEVV
ncbi:radical SAM protein [bacterium]|nr:radical SAM protein [bacterium]